MRKPTGEPCTFEGCGRPLHVLKYGLCRPHYDLQRLGKPLRPLMVKRRPRDSAAVVARDAHGRKECCRCLTWQDEAAFARSVASRDGLQVWCNDCRRKHYENNAEAVRDRNRLSRFGLSREAFDDLLASQGGCCAICGADSPGSSFWHVDHDHTCCPSVPGRNARTCGRCVRGILCGACNIALGHVDENVATLLAMVAYLQPTRSLT